MRRSKVVFLVSVIATCAVLVAACAPSPEVPKSGQATTSSSSTTPGAGKAMQFVMGTGPTGGVFQVIGGGIAQLINESVPGVNVTAQTTAGGIENTRRVGTGEIDLGLIAADQGLWANAGQPPFKDEKLKVECLGSLYSTVLQIVVLDEKKEINSFQDLKGKRVALGEPGGGAEVMFKQALAGAGMKIEDIKAMYVNYEQATDQMLDGVIDASVILAGAPSPTIVRLASSKKIKMIPIAKDHADKIKADSPQISLVEIPSGTFPGQDKPFFTIGTKILLGVRAGFDPEVAYKMTKAVYGNLDKLVKYHSSAKQIDPKTAFEATVPLNEGAKRYFKEIGVLK